MFDLQCIRFIQYIRLDIQQVEDPFRCRQSLLQCIELVGQILDRVKELGEIQIESYDLPGCQPVTDTLDEAQSDSCGIDERNQRTVDSKGCNDVETLFPQFFVLFCKLFILGLLLVEDLCQLHAGEVFGQESIQIRNAGTLFTEVASYFLRKYVRNDEEYDNNPQHRDRQLYR